MIDRDKLSALYAEHDAWCRRIAYVWPNRHRPYFGGVNRVTNLIWLRAFVAKARTTKRQIAEFYHTSRAD